MDLAALIRGVIMSIKQVILVRKDLDMPPGKLAAQVAHASLNAYVATSLGGYQHDIFKWIDSGATKVVLEVQGLTQLAAKLEEANARGLSTALVTDEGRTVFNEPTITCGAIGPADSDAINLITGGLLLYK